MKTVPLTQGYEALVDDEDYERVSHYRWRVLKNANRRYAIASPRINGVTKTLYLHRFIMDAGTDVFVDHKDGNGLDNQKHNLRFATPQQNSRNNPGRSITSKYKGVSWDKRRSRWKAQIGVARGCKTMCCGRFDTEEQAARAADAAALAYHGDFARLNFPLSEGDKR